MSLLEASFISILNMSITASYVAIAVIIARLLLRKSPKIFSYALWSIVLFRLVCPYSFSSGFSLFALLNSWQNGLNPNQYIPQNIGRMATPAIDTGLSSINTTINGSLPAATPFASANPMQLWIALGTYIWLFGFLVMLIYAGYTYLRLQTHISTATFVADNIYETDLIKSPFVCGLIMPKIYLPLSLTGSQREYILCHEQVHIKRLDYLIKPLAFFALALHWFNPLIWLSFSLMTTDMEMSCDEQVLKHTSPKDITGYSGSLLALALQQKIPSPSPLAFGESNVKARIKNVLNYTRPTFGVIVLSLIAVIILAVTLLSNPGSNSALKNNNISYDTEALLKSKTPYIGNNSKVMALVNSLPLPEGINRETIKLYTSAPPYGLTINYRLENDSVPVREEQFLRNSLLLFALIDNVEKIDHQGYWNNKALSSIPFRFSHSRPDAERVVGGDIRQFATSKERLAELIELVQLLKDEPKRTAMKGLELYVWRKPELTGNNELHFTLLPGTNRNKTEEEVFNLTAATTDIENINRELATFDYVDVIVSHPQSISKAEMNTIADQLKLANGSIAIGTHWFDSILKAK